jgi:hypothetical protein
MPCATHDTLTIHRRVLNARNYVDGGQAAILPLAEMPR